MTMKSFLYLLAMLNVFQLVTSARISPEDNSVKSNAHASGKGTTLDISQKLERIENSLGAVAKSPLAPAGISTLLNHVHHADDEIKGLKNEKARYAIFQNISKEIAAFQNELVSKKKQLIKAEEVDKANKAKNFQSVVEKLKARETQIETAEQNAQMAHQKRKEEVAKMKPGSEITHESDHTQKILKYLRKKTDRKFHKNMAKWKEEKKELHEAIDAAKNENSDQMISGMNHLIHVEKGDQDFLH